MLMLGNLFRESGVVRQLQETASNALMYIVVILLGTSVGATTSAEAFLNWTTIKIVALGLIAFAFGTAAGVVCGKIMCKLTHGKVNPADRFRRRLGCTDGGESIAKSRRGSGSYQFSAYARNGAECGRRDRHRSRSRNFPRDVRRILSAYNFYILQNPIAGIRRTLWNI